MEQHIETRQRYSLGALIFLTPALRLFPARAAALAGRAGWLTPLAALPLLLVYGRFLTELLALRREGESLPGLISRAAGVPGLSLCTLWLLLYAAFVLRSGADRFVGTIYPRAAPSVFSAVMGMLALAGALSGFRTLARLGRMLLPFLAGVLLLLLLVALPGARLDNLWPLHPADLPGLARGALVPVDLVAGAAAALCFVPRGKGEERGGQRPLSLWMLGLCGLLTLLALTVTGRFGHELGAELARPFFVLVRTLRIFRSLERFEALVVMLWIFPDFLTAALFLRSGAECLQALLGLGREGSAAERSGLRDGRLLIWAAALAATGLALLLSPEAQALSRWSEVLIPAANLAFCFVLLPAVYLLARAKKRKEAEKNSGAA